MQLKSIIDLIGEEKEKKKGLTSITEFIYKSPSTKEDINKQFAEQQSQEQIKQLDISRLDNMQPGDLEDWGKLTVNPNKPPIMSEEVKYPGQPVEPVEKEGFELSAYQEPEKSILDKVKASIAGIFKIKPEAQIAKSQVIYNISQATGKPINEVEKNLPAYTKALGIRGMPTSEEFLSAMFTFPVTAALISNPVTTGIGITKFLAMTEAENFIISKIKKIGYEFGAGKGLKELAPEDTNQITKDVIDVIDFIAKGYLIGKTDKNIMKMWNKFTKDISTKYGLPEKMYLNVDKIKDMHLNAKETTQFEQDIYASMKDKAGIVRKAFREGGVDIEIPATEMITFADKPWYAKLKQAFGVKPFSQTVINKAGEVKLPTLAIEGEIKPKLSTIKPTEKPSYQAQPAIGEGKGIEVAPAIPAELEGLAEEARKYGSAEEFENSLVIKDKDNNDLYDLFGRKPMVNPDGTLTVYHATTLENAKKIEKTGIKDAKDIEGGEVYFSTKPQGGIGFGDYVIEMKIKPSLLLLDDAFRDGELHLHANEKDLLENKVISINKVEDVKNLKPFLAEDFYHQATAGKAGAGEGTEQTSYKYSKYSTPEWKVTDEQSLEKLGNSIAKDVGMKDVKIKWYYDVNKWYDTEVGETIRGYVSLGKTKDGEYTLRINIPRLYTEKTETPYMREELVQTILHELGHIAEKTPAGTFEEMHPKNLLDWQTKHAEAVAEKATAEGVLPTTGKGKVSKIAKDIEATAIEQGLTEGFGHLAEFTPAVIKEDARISTELVNNNIDEARKMIRGEIPLAGPTRGIALVKAMEKYAIETGDGEILNELASSPLTGETSVAGSILSSARVMSDPLSPVNAIKDINKKLEESVKKKYPGKVYENTKKSTINKFKETVKNESTKANTQYSWESFIKSITCA